MPVTSGRYPVKRPGNRVSRPGGRGLVRLLLGMVLLSGCASSGVSGPFSLVPAEGGKAVFSHEGLVLSARHLDKGEGEEYLRSRGFQTFSAEVEKLNLTIFLLRVVNGSGKTAILDPAGTRFLPGSGPALSPMTYAHLYTDLPPGPSRGEMLRGFQGASLDRLENISPDETLERLLFFRRPEKVAPEAGILFEGLYLGGKQVDGALLSFRSIPVEE